MKHVPNQVSANAERHKESETRLQGRLLRVTQAAWIPIAVLSCILFVVSLPAFYTQTQSICTGNACIGVQVSPEQAHSLAAHGISLTGYAWYSVLVTILSTLIWVSVGWLIFWHKSDWLNFLNTVLLFLLFAQIYRYRSVSTPVQRQQSKWIVFAISIIILTDVKFIVPVLFNPALFPSSSLYALIISNISLFVLLLGLVSIYIAIMRYRLHDIDVIINRSLVYSSLTGLLALIYLGLVIGLGSQTMQPAHVSLWLRKPDREVKHE